MNSPPNVRRHNKCSKSDRVEERSDEWLASLDKWRCKVIVDGALEPYLRDPPLVVPPAESVIVDAIELSMTTPQCRMV